MFAVWNHVIYVHLELEHLIWLWQRRLIWYDCYIFHISWSRMWIYCNCPWWFPETKQVANVGSHRITSTNLWIMWWPVACGSYAVTSRIRRGRHVFLKKKFEKSSPKMQTYQTSPWSSSLLFAWVMVKSM